MTSFIQQYGYLAVLLIIGLESLGIPLPGETTLITASLYAGATGNLNIFGVVAAGCVGAIVGDNIGYLIGHWGGYRILVRFGKYVRLDQAKVKVARYLFKKRGGIVVFFGRFISILRAYAAFLAGVSRMPWRNFLFFNAAGGITWASLYGFSAFFLGNELTKLGHLLALAFGVVGLVGIVGGILFIRSHEKRLEALAEIEFPGILEGYPGGKQL